MPVTRIHFYSGPAPRPKPKAGDRRTTKKHGEQVRVMKMVRNFRGEVIGLDCTGGRQNYEWVSLVEAVKRGDGYLLKPEERAALAL